MVELGAIHRLSDGDVSESPPCHGIPGHPTADRQKIGRVVDGKLRNAGGGHVEVLNSVPHRCPPDRNRGAQGQDFHCLVLRGKLRTAVR